MKGLTMIIDREKFNSLTQAEKNMLAEDIGLPDYTWQDDVSKDDPTFISDENLCKGVESIYTNTFDHDFTKGSVKDFATAIQKLFL
jgi:hypothetical protein